MDQDTPADLAFCMMMDKEYKGYLPLFTDGSKVNEMKHCGASETIEHLMIICRESEQERREITEFFRQKKVQSSLYMLLGGFDSEEEN
ncbi:hypothetical protein QYM36_016733, partial [Artemia franciscana]